MVRLFALISVVFFASSPILRADEPDPRLTRAVTLQTSMDKARELLKSGNSAEAVAVLEAEILRVNGNANFLALLKEAYVAHLGDLKAAKGHEERIEHVIRQLKTLDPKLNLDEVTKAQPMPVVEVPPMPVPVEPAPMPAAVSEPTLVPVAIPSPGNAKREIADPFQQTPLDRVQGGAAIKERPKVPEGWELIEAGSFRVFFQKSRPQAQAASKLADQVRAATFEKWSGTMNTEWSPRCDIWIHASAADYSRATNKPAGSPGHASVAVKDGRILNRRIDVRLDDAGMLDVTLPREVAYVVVADLFPEQAPPRWADIGMSIHAETPAEISRYVRAVPKLIQDKKLINMRDLLNMADFPEASKITPYYVESVSLVEFLVRLKGARAFALYLREAPRRGYEEALQRHYGIKDATELQERWLKFAMSGE